jgi:hypothetical protein
MYWPTLIGMVVCGMLVDAQNTYKSMENKICAAKCLHECDAVYEVAGRSTRIKWDYRLASDNNVKLVWHQPKRVGKGVDTIVFGSNGTTLTMVINGELAWVGPEEMPFDLPRHHKGAKPFDLRVSMICRVGLAAYLHNVVGDDNVEETMDFNEKTKTRDHVLLGKEKVGSCETAVLAYAVDFPSGRIGKVKIWINVSTMFPLKREVTVFVRGREAHSIETYSVLRLDPKTDSKFFEVEK